MTSYYMNNSCFAKNFVETPSQTEFVSELNSQRKIAEFLSYDSNVINTTSVLFGGEGTRIQLLKDKQAINIELDRSYTQRKFLNGELSYRPTILGGCSRREPCSKISFTSVLSCVGCPDSIFDESTLPRVELAMQTLSRKKLIFPKDGPSYLQLQQEEHSLREFLDRCKKEISRRT